MPSEPPAPGAFERLRRFFFADIWTVDLVRPSRWKAALYKFARVLTLAVHGYVSDRCTFHAAALTYITLVSIVPLLALAMATARGLGYYDDFKANVLAPFLEEYAGDTSGEVPGQAPTEGASNGVRQFVDGIVEEVDRIDTSSLGLIGLLVFVFATVKLLAAIERSFNDIWGARRSRTWVRKLSDYVTIVLIPPVFLASGTAVTAWLDQAVEWEVLGPVVKWVLRFAPMTAIWGGFALMYITMPNTKVAVSSAALGGVVGGTAWHLTQVAYLKLQIGLAGYNAVLAGFAFVPMLLFWVYLSWVVVLVGAQVAFAHQHEKSFRGMVQIKDDDQALREDLALRVMLAVADHFDSGEAPWRSEPLATRLGVAVRPLEEVLERLVRAGLLVAGGDERDPMYLPARDLDAISVKEIVDTQRIGPGGRELPAISTLDKIATRAGHSLDRGARAAGGTSLRALVGEARAETEVDPDVETGAQSAEAKATPQTAEDTPSSAPRVRGA